MKKKLYLLIPFVVIPLSMLLCELLDNMELLQMSSFIAGAMFLLISAVVGFFSPTHRTFDYLLTTMMPLSLFCFMFIAGFLDQSDLGTRFLLYKAVDAAFQPMAIKLYFLMATVTFLASFKYFRNIKKSIFNN